MFVSQSFTISYKETNYQVSNVHFDVSAAGKVVCKATISEAIIPVENLERYPKYKIVVESFGLDFGSAYINMLGNIPKALAEYTSK